MSRLPSVLLVLALSAPAICATPYRFSDIAKNGNSDSLFIIVTFSGGGTRAAAFAYGVLDELRRTQITWEGGQTTLLGEVDVISSVSGGSFTAAYYGVYREKTFASFSDDFLYRRNSVRLGFHVVRNLFSLIFTHTNRSDVAADYYSSILGPATLGTIGGQGRPFVIINATDMAMGAPFEFTQDTFDYLCDDASVFPVARAVAASAAFPVALSPLMMASHGGSCRAAHQDALKNAEAGQALNEARYRKAQVLDSYLDAKQRPVFPLIDGGVGDNLGVHVIIDAINEDFPLLPLRRYLQFGAVKKIVVISVDASTGSGIVNVDPHNASAPGVLETAGAATSIPIDNHSRELLDNVRVRLDDATNGLATPYFIPLSFDALPETRQLKTVPTSLTLPREQVDAIIDAGRKILRGNAKFQELLRDLDETLDAGPIETGQGQAH